MNKVEDDVRFMDSQVSVDRCWLVCYPRSGSTWLRMILANVMHPEEPRGYRDTDYMVPDFHSLHKWNWDKIRANITKPFVVKSHHYLCEAYATEKVVYLVRDPRDVVISEYHFNQWEMGKEQTFQEFFDLFVSGKMKFQSWKLHVFCAKKVNEWNDMMLMPIRYEDLYDDPVREVGKVCDFMQYSASQDEIRKAVEKSTFEKCIERSYSEALDPRKRGLQGKPGGWKDVLTQEQQDRIWAWAGVLMSQLDYRRSPV